MDCHRVLQTVFAKLYSILVKNVVGRSCRERPCCAVQGSIVAPGRCDLLVLFRARKSHPAGATYCFDRPNRWYIAYRQLSIPIPTNCTSGAHVATRKPKTLHFWQGHLPHWQVENGRYFVTIHLHSAVPKAAHQRIHILSEQFRREEMECANDQRDRYLKLSRKIFLEMERWLDSTPAVSHFQQSKLCEMAVEAIEHRQRAKVWDMFSFAIMPSHIHLFFEFSNELSLKSELEEFKRWTGHQAVKIDAQLKGNRFWQIEWFDHWSRSDEEDEKIIQYIRNNPVKSGLAKGIGQYQYCK